MFWYFSKRLTILPLVLFLLTVLIFSLVLFLSPYQRLAVFIPSSDVVGGNIPFDELVAKYGLNKPFYVQYWNWLNALLHGNMGWSPTAGMPVGEALCKYFPATLELMLVGALMVFPCGIWLGKYTAVHHNELPDQVARVVTILGITLPVFVFGLMLLVVFYGWLAWFPPGRLSQWAEDLVIMPEFHAYTGMHTVDGLLNGRPGVTLDALRHLLMPALAYSVGHLATLVRMTRSSLLETLNKEYVMTARAKGLLERVVVRRHALRNALLPVVTLSGGMVARMLGGAVIVETVFNFRGMGMFIVTAAQGLDFPAILGTSLCIGVVIVLTNLAVDLLYVVLDPTVELR